MERLGPPGQAWSVSRLLFGLGDVHDAEGRPLGERRASSAARVGVPIELVPCPYDDERHGLGMNVSALDQIKRYLGDTHADVAAFHESLDPAVDPWTRAFLAVIDQLVAPARFVIKHERDQTPVTGMVATGHKLAAGLFAVMQSVDTARVHGEQLEATGEALMARVHATRALIGGGREACAGPLRLIRRTVAVFMGEHRDACAKVEPERVAIAQCLHQQLRLGILLRCVDQHAERMLLGELGARATPLNPFIRGKLEARIQELAEEPVPPSPQELVVALPTGLREEHAVAIRDALTGFGQAATRLPELVRQLDAAVRAPKGAIRLHDDAAAREIAPCVAAALWARRATLAALWSIEGDLRQLLAREDGAPVRFSGLVLPHSWTLFWFGALTGHHISMDPKASPEPSVRVGCDETTLLYMTLATEPVE